MMTIKQVVGLVLCAMVFGAMAWLMVEGIIVWLRGPRCSCGHAAASHTLECLAEGCKCKNWTDPNRSNT
jgi:hypothetical protein